MAAVVALPQNVPSREPTPPPTLTLNTDSIHNTTPPAVPNKHIPFCSPGTVPSYGLISPPASPPSPGPDSIFQHVLSAPDSSTRLSGDPPFFSLGVSKLQEALEQAATQPLPDPAHVFPWLHGLHQANYGPLQYFGGSKKISRCAPRNLRGLTLVKAGGNLQHSVLKGAVAPDELLAPLGSVALAPCFRDVSPHTFSVRNFQTQTGKVATVSDIVIYGDDTTPRTEVDALARTFSQAQLNQRMQNSDEAYEPSVFHTFIVTEPFSSIEQHIPDAVAVDSSGMLTGKVMDFVTQERLEMCALSKASEIAPNVWLGPTALDSDPDAPRFDIVIEASDIAPIPLEDTLAQADAILANVATETGPACLEFPSSGSFAAMENGLQNHDDVARIIAFFHWLHKRTTPIPSADEDGDIDMTSDVSPPRKVLIHCQDGYTETSLVGLAYIMYSAGIPAHEAWMHMHTSLGRNFFTYPADKYFLENIQLRILQESPAMRPAPVMVERPAWMRKMDGSLPSRLLSYLYLGNISHAQNPELLRLLGITRILSIGEPIRWSDDEIQTWGAEKLLFVDNVQDNGCDPLTADIEKCLDFIAAGKNAGESTLVHCRVGVSRSATICIAEVMNETGLSFPRAYCFVRARRLNVIIQPHLRFSYELLKYEEAQRVRRGLPLRRELEWPTICREIALMNKPYCRQ